MAAKGRQLLTNTVPSTHYEEPRQLERVKSLVSGVTYVYDGGSIVRIACGEFKDCSNFRSKRGSGSYIDGISTYYVGGHFELQVEGTIETETKYYNGPTGRYAMRESILWIACGEFEQRSNSRSKRVSDSYDHLQSSSVILDEDGDLISRTTYTAFGEERNTVGSSPTDYTYTGQRSYTDDFGLMYYVARWYDPVLAHFTSADTIIPDPGNSGDWNRYAYVNYNPVLYSDPTGHFSAREIMSYLENEYGDGWNDIWKEWVSDAEWMSMLYRAESGDILSWFNSVTEEFEHYMFMGSIYKLVRLDKRFNPIENSFGNLHKIFFLRESGVGVMGYTAGILVERGTTANFEYRIGDGMTWDEAALRSLSVMLIVSLPAGMFAGAVITSAFGLAGASAAATYIATEAVTFSVTNIWDAYMGHLGFSLSEGDIPVSMTTQYGTPFSCWGDEVYPFQRGYSTILRNSNALWMKTTRYADNWSPELFACPDN